MSANAGRHERIPRILHFFWGEPHTPPLIQHCMESWKKHLPDFTWIEWGPSNLPKIECRYYQEAIEAKKWAFVSDYVRLHALIETGGIYLDTDVEVLGPLDSFLEHRAFASFEDAKYLNATLLGAEPGHPWIHALIRHYDGKAFRLAQDRFDLTPNPWPITRITSEQFGLIVANRRQSLSEGLEIYPNDFFCPKNWQTGRIRMTRNTKAIHHFNAAWWSDAMRRREERRKRLKRIFGIFIGKVISVVIERTYRTRSRRNKRSTS